jgi:acetaldehyde dehydrogenase
MGVATTHECIDGSEKMPEWQYDRIVFDKTSAGTRKRHDETVLGDAKLGARCVDLFAPDGLVHENL